MSDETKPTPPKPRRACVLTDDGTKICGTLVRRPRRPKPSPAVPAPPAPAKE